MRGARRPIDVWLADIAHWGDRLARHIDGLGRKEFMADQKAQDAAAKCAEAIGEAAKEILKMDPSFDSFHRDLKLRDASKFRNRLSNGYYSINLPVLWDTITTSVPATVAAAKHLLEERGSPQQ
jgi:uncharacterized protein with HEPN domain